jgi:hypothetical protein
MAMVALCAALPALADTQFRPENGARGLNTKPTW